MNICLLNDSFPPAIDGVVNVVMNYARILKEAPDIKANVMVVTPEYPGEQYEGKYPYEVVTYKSVDTTRLANGYRTGNPLAIKAITRINGVILFMTLIYYYQIQIWKYLVHFLLFRLKRNTLKFLLYNHFRYIVLRRFLSCDIAFLELVLLWWPSF